MNYPMLFKLAELRNIFYKCIGDHIFVLNDKNKGAYVCVTTKNHYLTKKASYHLLRIILSPTKKYSVVYYEYI